MPRTLTASDKDSLVKLAASLPKGSPERKVILAGLKAAGISKKAEIHDGRHAHIFGYDNMNETISVAEKFGGKVTKTGIDWDADGDAQDWADLEFPSKEQAFSFVNAVDWKRADARLHIKDVQIFGVGVPKW